MTDTQATDPLFPSAPAPADTATPADSSSLPAAAPKHNKVCDYYLTRGCVKADDCDYIHPTAPDGSITTKLCDYFLHPRGCVKAAECNFLHIPAHQLTGKYKEQHVGAINAHNPKIQKICEYYMTRDGCKKAAQCEYLHPGFGQAFGQAAMAPVGLGGVKAGVCMFFNSPAGCKKGVGCDRLHSAPFAPAGFGFNGAFDPYAAVGGAGLYAPSLPFSRPPPPPTSKTHPTRPVPSPFFAQGGCKKGESCDYVHQRPLPCEFFQRGNCVKGERCDYVHEMPVAPIATAGRGGGGYGGVRRGGRTSRYNPY